MLGLVEPQRLLPAQPDGQALIEEARRHQRHRRWRLAVAGFLAVTVAGGGYVLISGGGGPGPAPSSGIARSALVGPLGNATAYLDCPGSTHVGPTTSPDFLPAAGSGTDSLPVVVSIAEVIARGPYLGFSHAVPGLPSRLDVKAIRVGPGGGYAWTRDPAGQSKVVKINNYGIYIYLKAPSDCPDNGWARWAANGVQVTFLAPKIL